MNVGTQMAVFKLAFLALLLMCCLHCIKAMGLCDFADKFPCEDNEGSVCFKSPGCKGRSPRQGQTTQHTTQLTTQQKRITTKHTSEVSTRPKATDNLITSQLTTQQNKVTTEHVTSKASTRPKKTDNFINTTSLCPPNWVHENCTTCQRTCSDPKGCITNCTEPEICICADGFLLEGGDCVPEEECGCFIEGEGIIHEGGFYVNPDCTSRADCVNGQLIWDTMYTCSANAVCVERNSIRQCYTHYADCLDVYNDGFTTSDVYTIKPTNWPGSPFQVYCNMTGRGGWTTFQRRADGTVDFYQNWTTYKEGFGYLDHEHWLGNEKLYYLTNQKPYTIRIDLVNLDDLLYYATFDYFRIKDVNDSYRLSHVGLYNGTAEEGRNDPGAGYAFRYHLNYQFSTYDNGNTRCAVLHHGSWWYVNCFHANLNGRYVNVPGNCRPDQIHVSFLPGNNCIKYVEMKLRPF